MLSPPGPRSACIWNEVVRLRSRIGRRNRNIKRNYRYGREAPQGVRLSLDVFGRSEKSSRLGQFVESTIVSSSMVSLPTWAHGA